MKRKITSAILSATLLLSSFAPYSYADPSQQIDQDGIEVVSLSANSESSEEKINPVLLSLLRQTEKKYQDNDEITFIAEISDKAMAEKYSLVVPDISKIRTEEGLAAQLEYAKKSQGYLMDAMDDLEVQYAVTESFDTALNGLAIRTTLEKAKQIANLPEIASIEVSRTIIAPPEVKQQGGVGLRDASSNDMVNAPQIWGSYTGKGQLIAIIDSGADPLHEIFKDFNQEGLKIKNKEQMDQLIQSKGLSAGAFFNEKIPFGYNYADKNQKIKERGRSSHGMHVAGIIAANSKKLRGVAPDAQLVIMRAFSDNMLFGGTTPEIYNKAIDDAVKLGVDSINMSLGATGTTDGRMEETTLNSLRDAQAAGIVVAIAIGNDGFMGFGALDGPGASNPDFGLTNSPGVADISLAVASVDNAKIKQRGIIVETPSPGNQKRILFMATDDKEFPTNSILVVDAGRGYADEIPATVKDKIALIQRGDTPGKKPELSFFEKVKNAQEKGAKAVIVFNHLEEDSLTHMAGMTDEITIPSCFISKEDGEFIIKNIKFPIRFEEEESYTANPTGYKLSSFSSWGVSPEGNLKPDISAPGGQIYSSVNDDTYQMMSGTSMATPHVAGGIAIAKQYVESKFKNITGEEKHRLVKNLLMSTAVPYLDTKAGAHGSPRGQGAGLMNLARLIKSEVTIEGTNNISSINLRNITDKTVRIEGYLRNYSNEEKTFDYYAVLNTDTVQNGTITLKPKNLMTSSKQEISVGAGQRTKFTVEFELKAEDMAKLSEQMPKGYFLEGYVFFDPKDEVKDPQVSVPFVGFKGDFNKLNVIDDSIYHHLAAKTKPYYYEKSNIVKYGFTHLSSKAAGETIALGEMPDSTYEKPNYDLNKIAFSPNGDGKADSTAFVGTFLRNYKDFEMNVYLGNDGELTTPIYRVVNPNDFGIKNYIILGPFGGPNLNTTKPHWTWDGTNIAGQPMPEGAYKLVVQAKPDGAKDDTIQKMVFPITIDNTFPRITKSSYDMAKGEFVLSNVVEDGSGIREQIITMETPDGKNTVYQMGANKTFKLPKNTDPKKAVLKIQDNAFNTLELPLDKAVRTGEERMIIVSPKISSGSVPSDKFKWEVRNEDDKTVDSYNLPIGKYKLVITEVDPAYEVEEAEIPFEITATDFSKVVEVKFSYKNRSEIIVNVNNARNALMKIIFIDKQTGKEYIAVPQSPSQSIISVPEGEYKVTVRDFDEETYIVSVQNDNIVVGKGLQKVYPSVTIVKKDFKDITVNLVRNEYAGKATIVFRGRDVKNTLYTASFAAGEDSKKIKLPRRVKFDIYTTELDGNTHGANTIVYEALANNKYTATVELIKGGSIVPLPVDKSDLLILINKVSEFKEKDYEPEGWELFEKALDKAQKLYKDTSVNQETVDAMLKELQEAINGLSLISGAGNKAALWAKIEEAKRVLESLKDDYEEMSVEFLVISIQGAEVTYRSKDPKHNTEKHINDTIDLLERAIQNLKRKDGKVDTSQLAALIAEAEDLLKDKNNYTKSTVEDLEFALQEANDALNGTPLREGAVKDAILSLRLALGNLTSIANKDDLKKEIDESDQIELSKYELQGKSAFRLALREAKEVYYNKRALQDEINKATALLKEKREALTPKKDGGTAEGSKRITFKNNSELKSFIKGDAKVTKTGSGYQYTITTKTVKLPLNGVEFDGKIIKMKVNGQVINAKTVNGMNEFTFELTSEATELNVELTVDLLEELGAKPLVETLVFR